jgi:hypothetical protein
MSLRQWQKLMADNTANAACSVFLTAVAIPLVYGLPGQLLFRAGTLERTESRTIRSAPLARRAALFVIIGSYPAAVVDYSGRLYREGRDELLQVRVR